MDWISVKDRLPTSKDFTVIACGHHKVFVTIYANVVAGNVYATHWMPLPDPPETDETEDPEYMDFLKECYAYLIQDIKDTCKWCRHRAKCEYATLPSDLRGESCQYYSLAERFGADDK